MKIVIFLKIHANYQLYIHSDDLCQSNEELMKILKFYKNHEN